MRLREALENFARTGERDRIGNGVGTQAHHADAVAAQFRGEQSRECLGGGREHAVREEALAGDASAGRRQRENDAAMRV